MQLAPMMWKKSSHSQMNGQCVEVAAQPANSVHVRDSTNPEGAIVRFGWSEWRAFLGNVREGKFGPC